MDFSLSASHNSLTEMDDSERGTDAGHSLVSSDGKEQKGQASTPLKLEKGAVEAWSIEGFSSLNVKTRAPSPPPPGSSSGGGVITPAAPLHKKCRVCDEDELSWRWIVLRAAGVTSALCAVCKWIGALVILYLAESYSSPRNAVAQTASGCASLHREKQR